MIYEERIYTIMPGKMADIERRFADHTLKLFEKHGIKVVGFWKTVLGRQLFELVYIVQFKDVNERMERWEAFGKDPEWIKARNDSETHGPLVAQVENKILSPLPFSPLK
ncbi:MAG: NIPSNAP family protein [Gemmataceae bacterium]